MFVCENGIANGFCWLFRHYVAFIRKNLGEDGESWVLFNDEKVVEGGDVGEMSKFAYVYFFKRVGGGGAASGSGSA